MKALNSNGIMLLEEIIEEIDTATQKQICDILSIQGRIQKNNSTGKWSIEGKKKGGGYLNIDTFRKKLLHTLT